jgi:DNA-binding beta-propeller fold protein YncE
MITDDGQVKVLAWAGLALLLLLAGCRSSAETSPEAATPVFEIQHGWPVLPAGRILGFVSGVDADSHGHVFSFHTYTEWQDPFRPELEPTAAVQVWDPDSGELIDSWGEDFFRMPHGLSVDPEDNVWVTDVAHNQVFKFTHDGDLQLTLGERGVEGTAPGHFAQPTDVAFGPDGSVYVSDGYVNGRIVNFTTDGTYRFEWGQPGRGSGEFEVPHDLAIDTRGRVYVADRENDRIQIFEADGEFVEEWSGDGTWRPYGIDFDPARDHVFVIDGGVQPYRLPYRSAVVVFETNGTVVDRFGSFGNHDGQFIMGHDIALARDGSVLVADVLGRRLQRFKRVR